MLGAIIGDIAGSRFEFNPTNDYNFELFTLECGFTDDTICTVAVADAILRHEDSNFGKIIHEWCRRYPNPMGSYGGRFAQWVRSDNPNPYGCYQESIRKWILNPCVEFSRYNIDIRKEDEENRFDICK